LETLALTQTALKGEKHLLLYQLILVFLVVVLHRFLLLHCEINRFTGEWGNFSLPLYTQLAAA
jgi:hypothetical protein